MRSLIRINKFFKPNFYTSLNIFKTSVNYFKFSTSNSNFNKDPYNKPYSSDKSNFESNQAGEERRNPSFNSDRIEIFVSNLPFSAETEDLGEYFSKFGEIISAKVVKDRETNRSRGFGFVEFASLKDRDNALQQNHSLMGRIIYAKPAEKSSSPPLKRDREEFRSTPERDTRSNLQTRGGNEFETSERSIGGRGSNFEENKTIFIGNLDFNVTEDRLIDEFKKHGNISKFRVPRNLDGGIKGMAFIEYESEASMKEALSRNGEIILGRNIRINKYTHVPPTRNRSEENSFDRPRTFRRETGSFESRDNRSRSFSEDGNRSSSRRSRVDEEFSD